MMIAMMKTTITSEKGPVGHYELILLVSEVAKRLQQEGYCEKLFGKKIPIIIHGLEYTWYDIEATNNANLNGEATVFIDALTKFRNDLIIS